VSCPPPQWGERISGGNSTAAAESVNTNAESRTTRPAGTDASPAHNFRSAAALSAPVTSTVRYLGIEVDDALEMAEQTEA
jgi:hypothetical protein